MEIWKDIEGYNGFYQVSSCGRVRSKNKILKPQKNGRGYYRVGLKGRLFFVHRLVAKHFVDNPNGYPLVNHKDENKTNNCADNLEWCTNLYNIHYGSANEKLRKTLKRKPVRQILPNGEEVIWESTRAVERETGYSHTNIAKCCKGIYKTAYKCRWEYVGGAI